MDLPDLNLDWLYSGFAWVLIQIHALLGQVFDPDSGLAWGFSIVLLTFLVRLVIFPLFVKQIRSQRAMAQLQPQLKELQQKYKNDKQKLQEEMMKLYRENGANPLSGCLPIIAQAPFFFAMYHVLNAISRDEAQYGLSAKLVDSASHAKVFGVPLGSMFKDNADTMAALGANPTLAKVVIIVFVVIMAGTTFIAQRQLMIKQNAQQAAAGQQTPFQQQQKIMLFILPGMFLVWGFFFPMGLIVYWTTSNLWTMGQQFWVLHRMPHQPVAGTAGGGSGRAGGGSGGPRQPAKPGTPGPAGNGTAAAKAKQPPRPAGNGTTAARRFTRRRREPETVEVAPTPQAVRRQQPARVPRSKRSGPKKKS